MKKLLIVLAAVTAILAWLPCQTQAQGGGGGGGGGRNRGNFDPAQMQQQMMERYKEMLAVDDDAWKAIEPRILKVTEARREASSMRGMFGAGGGRRGGGGGGGADTQGDQQPRRNFGPQPSVAAQDLQKALDSKASAETIKEKLAAYREDRKTKQENLVKAQEDLKKVLTLKQEAAAVLAGLLD